MTDDPFLIDVRQAPVGVFLADRRGLVRRANSTFARWHAGAGDVDVVGRSIAAWFRSERATQAWLEAPETIEVARPGESAETMTLSGIAGEDEILGIVAESAGAAAANERYARLVEDAPFPVVIIQDGIVVYANRTMEEIQPALGRRADELVISRMHPEDRELVISRIRARQRGEDVPNNYRFRFEVDGQYRWREAWSHRVTFRGRPAVQAITLDVDDRVQAERRDAERTRRSAHVQKLEALGRLAGGVAHDFNNLLTAVSGGVSLARQVQGVPAEAVAELDQILHAVRRAAELTRQLLAFGRDRDVEVRAVDVNAVIGRMSRLLERLAPDPVRVELALGAVPLPVRADAGRLEQALTNLVVNACEAMPDGGHVRVRTGETIARLTDPAEAVPCVEVVVEDDGAGIDPALLPHVFEPYFTTKDRAHATGLGLATVQEIARQFGGTAELTSGPDGTTARLLLPRDHARPGSEAPASASPRAEMVAASGRVLVVEDEPEVRAVVTRVLAHTGYEVTSVSGPDEALAAIDAGPPFDAVLSDIGMAKMNGFELADEIDARVEGVAILLMTGYTRHQGRGADVGRVVLRKPFTPTELLAALAERIARRG